MQHPTVNDALRIGAGIALLSWPVLGLLDGVGALVSAWPSLDGPAEGLWFMVLIAAVLLLPALGLGLGLGALGLGLSTLSRRLAAPSSSRVELWIGRLCALLAAAPVIWLGQQVFKGPRAQRIPGHEAIAVGLCGVSLWGLSRLVPMGLRLVRWVDAGGPRRVTRAAPLLLATSLACCGLYLVDRRVLPRLYPWFHGGLLCGLVGAALFGAAVFVMGTPDLRRRWRSENLRTWALCLSAATVGCLGLGRLERQVVLRGLVLEHSALASLVMRLHGLWRGAARVPALPVQPAVDETSLPPAGSQGPRLPNRDAFLITVDALRYDCVRPEIMPHASEIFAPGIRFERAYTQVPHTSFAVATLLTGKPVYALSAMGEDAARHETLPIILRRARYKTAAFYPPSVFFIEHDRLKGLEESAYGFEYVKVEYLPAERRTQQVMDFLEAEQPARTFVWIHYLEPHEPYDIHPGGPGPQTSDRTRYEGEVQYVDQEIGRLVAYIRAHRPGALLILGADHGEEFGEHGGRYHGTSLYEEQVHVPLMMVVLGADPGMSLARLQVAQPVGLIDVGPTLLGLLDIAASARMRGHDLGPWLSPGAPPRLPLWPVFAEIGRQKMVVVGSDKLICDLSADACALYDLERDPAERRNRIMEDPARAQGLRGRLDRFLEEANQVESEHTQGGGLGLDATAQEVLVRGRLGDHGALPGLARIILQTSAPNAAKEEAVALLGGLCAAAAGSEASVDGPGVRKALEATSSMSAAAQRWAKVGLGALGDAPARREAQRIADDETAPAELRLAAALAMIPRGAALPTAEEVGAWTRVLPGAMKLDDPDRVRPLLRALGQSRDRQALVALRTQLENVRSRVDVVAALGALGMEPAVDDLVPLLRDDPYVPVRAAAATALGRLGGVRALAALRSRVSKERETPVKAAIQTALRLQDPQP